MRVYRIKNAVRAVVIDESCNRLTELPAGAVLSLTNVEPDSNGMIEGTSGERSVLVFLNDLGERAEVGGFPYYDTSLCGRGTSTRTRGRCSSGPMTTISF